MSAPTPAKKPASRKPVPAPLAEPVIAADVAFGNVVTSTRDAAVVAQQALQNDRVTRDEYYEREAQRLAAARNVEISSLDEQIAQQVRIQAGCDAALAALADGAKVVRLRDAA